MPRKKKETTLMTDDNHDNLNEPQTATALVEPPAEPEPLPVAIPVQMPTATSQPVGNGQRRPAASWKFPAAAGVTIEVALWPHTITLSSGETIEVYNATLTRSYKDAQGNWQKGGSFRVSELMVLRHAIEVAHAHALNAREMNCPI
jgi:hypothetical protein